MAWAGRTKERYLEFHIHACKGGREIWKRFVIPAGMTTTEFKRRWNRQVERYMHDPEARKLMLPPERWNSVRVRRVGGKLKLLFIGG